MNDNLRYIIITQIGIDRWVQYHPDHRNRLPDLWDYIESRAAEVSSAGDLGLLIWAAAERNSDNYSAYLDKLLSNWRSVVQYSNAIELAWLLQGLSRFRSVESLSDTVCRLGEDCCNRLMSLYNPRTRLFARHKRKGLYNSVKSFIPCFADQIYPILALTSFAQSFGRYWPLDAAVKCADRLCQLQGPLGQWWWHYNLGSGSITEEYPVFSVHQDAMAPMAMLQLDEVAGTDHSEAVIKGLNWLDLRNELCCKMIVPERGVILRGIVRREIPKMYRFTRGVLITAKLNFVNRLMSKNYFGFAVNTQCRPYHLGLILYAWSRS